MMQTTRQVDFASRFRSLTGNPPMRWQERLFHSLVRNGIPAVIDLPTGFGKTMVMAIWLIARAVNASLPRRLVYVVDRRTVVDQATDLAISLQKNVPQVFPCMANLAISTLRGQLADNRDWTRDPSHPAIVIGTVDMIGSRLLFSGYRSSFKQRPLDAGLLGQDSLLVLDEAHLSKPFEKLICAIGENGPFETACDNVVIKPMRVIRMSATSWTDSTTDVFRLEGDFESRTSDFADDTARDRYKATKRLTIKTLGEKDKLTDKLAREAIELAENNSLCGKRIVVFIRKPDDAKAVAKVIREHVTESMDESDPKSKKIKNTPYANSVEVLTGTMRGLERDQLVEKLKDRWLNGDLNPNDAANETPIFVISTSAGEVGFDLNADLMVCDATTIDSLIQRLGRVNRRGLGAAQVHLIVEPRKKDKDGKPKKLEGIELAIANTIDLLKGVSDVSPKSLAALKAGAWKDAFAGACSPDVPSVELTDILLDAWSLTSITERMPGRPEVGPWLRGIDKEQAETTVAWRAELELFGKQSNPAKALKAVFAKHRVRPHECLTTYSYRVVEFLKMAVKPKGGRPDLIDTELAIRLPRGEIVMRTVRELIDDAGILNAEPTLILPATLGGLDEAGMISAGAIPAAPEANDPPLRSLDVADKPGYEQRKNAATRLRLVIRRTNEGNWVPESLLGGVNIPDRLNLKDSYSSSTALFADLRKDDLRIRLVQPVEFDDEDNAVKSLVMLAAVLDKTKPEDQSLDQHVGAVEKEARGIADRLELKGSFREGLLFAARWHDEGKKAEIWQRFVYGKEFGALKGKSSKMRSPKLLRGYRHEFGSLMRIHHPDRHATDCNLPTDAEARELAVHLIATHHGFGRPHFDNPTDREFQTKQCGAVHSDAIRRFARLQRKYGWWGLAWLESLLRCADALASADDVSEDDVGEANEESGEGS